MTTEADRFGVIRLSTRQLQHPELLTGLEAWLQLGLLSHTQVKQFCSKYLCCAVPVVAVDESLPFSVPAQSASTEHIPVANVANAAIRRSSDFADANPAPTANQPRTTWLTRSLQSLMAEIGVIWLLGLGVFMVVVSSGVLAASQWQNFSPVGQYSILLSYTLLFWLVSLWTSRQPALRLTAQMLQTATLLIIPVNFWMMDGLRLWQSSFGVIANVFAAFILTYISFSLTPRLAPSERYSRLAIFNSIGLSWLHWGWAITGMPLIATYAGTIGTALLTYRRMQHSGSPSNLSPTNDVASETPPPISLPTLIIALSTLLLLGRAILGAEVPVEQLGLAFGICGWLFCWLSRPQASPASTPRNFTSGLWVKIGTGLLLLGWVITVNADPPWQAVAISGLGLWLLGDRLRHRGTVPQLVASLLIGLQTYLMLWRLLPADWREQIITSAAQLFGTNGMPVALLGLLGLPYLWLMLGMARWLRQPLQQPKLATLTEIMAFGWGTVVLLFSAGNDPIRSLSLSLSALTLAITLRQRSLAAVWLYLTHALILAAMVSWIETRFPNLEPLIWAQILLVGMVIEWSLSLSDRHAWRQSCWHFGLGLASLSYGLLLTRISSADLSQANLVWLLTPFCLTGLTRLRQFAQPRLAAWLSAGSLILALFLASTLNSWMLSLAVATGLMLINTLTLQRFSAALLTVGFALGFEATAIYHYFSSDLNFERVMLLLTGNLWLLWLAQDILSRRTARLSQQYGSAANVWAIGISLMNLLSLSLYLLFVYAFTFGGDVTVPASLIWASGLIVAAMVYHLWRQAPHNLTFYGLAWATELFVITLIGRFNGSTATLAIGTLALGLISQLAGDVWVSRSRQSYRSSWHLVPLLYAGLGVLLGHTQFTATTGFYTLAAALIGIGVGRRDVAFKPLTQLSILAGSVAWYELLVYQLMQAEGEHLGDGLTLLAGLAALIALGNWLGQRWLLPYLRLQRQELIWIAHLHWFAGSGIAFFAPPIGLSDRGFWLWLLVGVALAGYAMANGRLTTSPNSEDTSSRRLTDRWLYAGIAEGLGILGYGLYRPVPDPGWLLAWGGTVAAIVAVALYFLPWQRGGWAVRPGRNMAMLLPGVVVFLTVGEITLQSLLIVAAFYAWIAKTECRIRLSYISLLLFDWAALRYLASINGLTLTGLGAVTAGSLLYIAQIDPALQTISAKEQRHWLRSFAVGLFSLTMLYQAELESGTTALLISLLTLGVAIGMMFVGLMLRVRAFLYVGTATFIIRVLRLLWLFINNYSLLLWAIGIVIGLLFIWIAATFEARRSQVNTLMQYWLTELTNWE